jgi:hypothetical protein
MAMKGNSRRIISLLIVFFTLDGGASLLPLRSLTKGQDGDVAALEEPEAMRDASQPHYNEGDFWIFRGSEREGITHTTVALHGEYKVLYSTGKLKVFRIEAGQEVEIPDDVTTYDFRMIRRLIGQIQDDLQYLQFPLFVGKEWKNTFRDRIRGTSTTVWNRVQNRVAAIEEVNTPAGIFRAFKIERRHIWQRYFAFMTYYYSPQTKSIVKYSYHEEDMGRVCCKREIELLNFGSVPGKTAS